VALAGPRGGDPHRKHGGQVDGEVRGAGAQQEPRSGHAKLGVGGRVSGVGVVVLGVHGGVEGPHDEPTEEVECRGEEDVEGEDPQEEPASARREDDAVLEEGEDARVRLGRGARHRSVSRS
jgi:hypothetical protein